MDPDHQLHLAAWSLAQAAVGHSASCGCSECCVVAKCLKAHPGLRRAVDHLCLDADEDRMVRRRGGGRESALFALEGLTGEDVR